MDMDLLNSKFPFVERYFSYWCIRTTEKVVAFNAEDKWKMKCGQRVLPPCSNNKSDVFLKPRVNGGPKNVFGEVSFEWAQKLCLLVQCLAPGHVQRLLRDTWGYWRRYIVRLNFPSLPGLNSLTPSKCRRFWSPFCRAVEGCW